MGSAIAYTAYEEVKRLKTRVEQLEKLVKELQNKDD